MNVVEVLTRYKAWADDVFLSAVASAPPAELTAPRPIVFGSLIRSKRLQLYRKLIKPVFILFNFTVFPLFALLEILQVFVEGRDDVIELGQVLHHINVSDFMFFQP